MEQVGDSCRKEFGQRAGLRVSLVLRFDTIEVPRYHRPTYLMSHVISPQVPEKTSRDRLPVEHQSDPRYKGSVFYPTAPKGGLCYFLLR